MQAAGYGLTRFYLAHTRINKLTLRSLADSSKGVAPAGEHSPGPLEVPQTRGKSTNTRCIEEHQYDEDYKD